jgi:hypothetical protein
MSNIGNGPYGGAITAALYLQKFITEGAPLTINLPQFLVTFLFDFFK